MQAGAICFTCPKKSEASSEVSVLLEVGRWAAPNRGMQPAVLDSCSCSPGLLSKLSEPSACSSSGEHAGSQSRCCSSNWACAAVKLASADDGACRHTAQGKQHLDRAAT